MTSKPFILLASSAVLLACGSGTTTNTGTTPGNDPGAGTPNATDVETSAVDTTVADAFTPVTESPPTVPASTNGAATSTGPVTESTGTPTTTSSAAPADPPPTTGAPIPPTAETAVVYGGNGGGAPWFPIVWWDGAAWNPAGYVDDGGFVSPPPPSIDSVSATSLDLADGPGQVVDGLVLGPEDFYCVGDEMGPVIAGVALPETPVSLGYDALAVTADWPLQPRPVGQVGADNPEYAAIGASLVDAPTADAGTVSQAVRADLDGDGIEEVLVTYEYLTDDQFGAENDFSVVYARLPRPDGTVTDQVLREYVLESPENFPTIGRFSIAAVADLNGDGIMEIATRSSFWESAGMAVWSYDGEQLSMIGAGGCGV